MRDSNQILLGQKKKAAPIQRQPLSNDSSNNVILSTISTSTTENAKPSRNKCLVEAYADGYLKFYADKDTDFFVFNRPWVTSAKNANLVEQLINQVIPMNYRRLYAADRLRQTSLMTRISVCDLEKRIQFVRLVEALQENKTPFGQIIRRVLQA